ncbi:hypothetical protein K3169_19735 [Pseudomonas phytophila]|uniref:Phage abortive infection protein n=1 Tax=Pseudomonas phytophila TaxID=2867264 RepID=A0ABY6F9P2_9PSED|nr:hypothetical protein [Pseudomonas phytophila]UXZ94583.1 hypothetical protein K3169_19735 [Pseudomonas phytophila]
MLPIVELVAFIILPSIVSVILVFAGYFARNRLATRSNPKAKKIAVFDIDPERGLAEQGLLWLSITTPFTYFLAFGHYIWADYNIQMSAEGFQTFIKISSLPLALLSLIVPLSLLVMRIHSTTQTATQIAVTKYKNNLDTYYAQRKAMFEYFATIQDIKYEGNLTGSFKLHPRLHLKFFRNTPPEQGIPAVNPHQIKKMLTLLQRARKNLHLATDISTENSERLTYYMNACTNIYKLANLMALEAIHTELKTKSLAFALIDEDFVGPVRDYKYLHTLGTSTSEIIGAFRYCRSYARLICEFCGQSTRSFEQLKYNHIDRGVEFNTTNFYDLNRVIAPHAFTPYRAILKTIYLDQ